MDYHSDSFRSHLLTARTHGGAVMSHKGAEPPGESAGRGTPLVRALALQGVSGTSSGSHLGSTLKPGGAVLTLGVSRRSGSVACVPADASPSEVLARSCWPSHRVSVKRSPKIRMGPSRARGLYRRPIDRRSRFTTRLRQAFRCCPVTWPPRFRRILAMTDRGTGNRPDVGPAPDGHPRIDARQQEREPIQLDLRRRRPPGRRVQSAPLERDFDSSSSTG
jgi:hypothetical protein